MRTPHTVFQNRRPTMARALIVSLIGVALVSIGLGPGGAAAGSIRNETASVVQTTVPMLTGEFQVRLHASTELGQRSQRLRCDGRTAAVS